MYSPCIREASQACFQSSCLTPFLHLPESMTPPTHRSKNGGASTTRRNFAEITSSSLQNQIFTNHESLPSLQESFNNFTRAYPLFSQTNQADEIRTQEFHHLSLSNHVCLDYIGHCLFSYSQNLTFRIMFGGQESEMVTKLKRRIMKFMNISESDYTMVFTANQTTGFKILADSYPFQSNKNLLTAYDYENESVNVMIEKSRQKGAKVMSAEFSWPSLRILSRKLWKMIMTRSKNKKRGLFVFPLQSRMNGARYPYSWLSIAQENGWHVLLDACALGTKDMETLGLSLFRPDFLICSFYELFGQNPSGFGCLFVKKTSLSVLQNFSASTTAGIVTIVPSSSLPAENEKNPSFSEETDEQVSEIVELEREKSVRSNYSEPSSNYSSEIELRGLDHADSLGLILISTRARYLINWLINAFMSLKHPNAENGYNQPLVRIYGPKIKINRGPSMAFNVFDWKGKKVDPTLVQKLADRNNISLSCGYLKAIRFSDKNEEEKEMMLEKWTDEEEGMGLKKLKSFSGIPVVNASLGFLTNFEDVYRAWTFVSRFLDADYVEKERWRYIALNQKTVEL